MARYFGAGTGTEPVDALPRPIGQRGRLARMTCSSCPRFGNQAGINPERTGVAGTESRAYGRTGLEIHWLATPYPWITSGKAER